MRKGRRAAGSRFFGVHRVASADTPLETEVSHRMDPRPFAHTGRVVQFACQGVFRTARDSHTGLTKSRKRNTHVQPRHLRAWFTSRRIGTMAVYAPILTESPGYRLNSPR